MQRATYLVVALILVGGLAACSRSIPYAPLSDEEKTKFEHVRQQVLDANPEMKAKETALKAEREITWRERKSASGKYEEVRRNLEDLDRQIFDEAYKIDPSVEKTYFRLQWEHEMGTHSEGLEKFIHDYGPSHSKAWMFTELLLRGAPFLATVVGLFVLFPTPSWAGANVLLICISVPAVFVGWVELCEFDFAYLAPMSGIYDGPTTPQLLEELHHEVEKRYLEYVPSLVLYLTLVARLLIKGRAGKKIEAGAKA